MISVAGQTERAGGITTAYEQRLIQRVRSAGRPSNVPRPSSWQVNRAIQQIDRTVDRFLHAVGLIRASRSNAETYWADGPALLTVDALPIGTAPPWRQHLLVTPWGTQPDPCQRLLAMTLAGAPIRDHDPAHGGSCVRVHL